MIFDKKVGEERKQFASQAQKLSLEDLKNLESGFTGDKSIEFYEGLLAGFISSFSLMETLPLPKANRWVGCIIAYLSTILEERS